MNAAHYRRLIDYSYWAHRRVWDCLMQLSDEQFTRPADYSIGSLHAQVVHTLSSEDLWLRRLRNEAPTPAFERTDAYPTRAAIRARWDEVEAEWRAFGAALTDDQLEQTFTFRSITGDQIRTLRLHALVEVIAVVAVRPAVKAAALQRREVVRHEIAADLVPLVHHGP